MDQFQKEEAVAIANVHTWLLTAICKTHPNPEALMKAFQEACAEGFQQPEAIEQHQDSLADAYLQILRARL